MHTVDKKMKVPKPPEKPEGISWDTYYTKVEHSLNEIILTAFGVREEPGGLMIDGTLDQDRIENMIAALLSTAITTYGVCLGLHSAAEKAETELEIKVAAEKMLDSMTAILTDITRRDVKQRIAETCPYAAEQKKEADDALA